MMPLRCVLLALLCLAGSFPMPAGAAPAEVRVERTGSLYQLTVNKQPFFIKGAGLENGDIAELARRGGNAFRTWNSTNGQAVLDEAQRNGVMVAMGLVVVAERHGFDYDDPAAVAAQEARIEAEVLRYRNHPALLMWVIGNELNLGAENPKVWDAVNRISRIIHRLDPHHPTLTTLAGFNPELAGQLNRRAGDLDLIGIQLYGDIGELPGMLEASNWQRPYVITEWGPTGHWQVPLTAWGAPIEEHSSRKAETLRERYRLAIQGDAERCLGSFVFLWGQKQERTPTWYGLFLESGEATESVDVLQNLWQDRWPDNRSPQLLDMHLDGKRPEQNITLRAGTRYSASVSAQDVDGDPLHYRWRVLHESTARSIGGDREDVPDDVPGAARGQDGNTLDLEAPRNPGSYRLFVTVTDGRGHAAYANIPFRVAAATQ